MTPAELEATVAGLKRAMREIVLLDTLYPNACCDGEEARDAIVEAWTIARRALRKM